MIKKTLVIGASTNPSRYSYLAMKQLIANGHQVIGVGKKEGEVNAVKITASKILYKDVDTVTLYLSKENQQEFYDYIISLNPKRVLFNPGTENEELENLLTKHHIAFEQACTLVLLSTGQY
jgi:predicted CoA-binding protein